MNRDEVRLAEQVVELAELAELGVDARALCEQDAHVEPASPSRDRRSDPAEPDDPERRPGDVAAEEALGPRAAPAAAPDDVVAFDDAPAHGENERECEVGGGGVEDTGCIRDGDPACPALRDVDPVVADTEVRDEAQRGEPLEGNRLVRNDQRLDVVARFLELSENHVSKLIECRAGVPPRGENLQAASVPCRHGLG